MKINPDVVHRNIAGDHVFIPIGGSLTQTDGMYILSEVGARIWELIENGMDRDAIIRQLCAEYDAPEQTIASDTDQFIQDMMERDLLLI